MTAILSSIPARVPENSALDSAPEHPARVPGNSGLREWVVFFLECLLNQKNALQKKVERERIIGDLPLLSDQIVQLAREHVRVTIAHAVKITGANRNTIKVHLKKLVETGRLTQRGAGRGTWYEEK